MRGLVRHDAHGLADRCNAVVELAEWRSSSGSVDPSRTSQRITVRRCRHLAATGNSGDMRSSRLPILSSGAMLMRDEDEGFRDCSELIGWSPRRLEERHEAIWQNKAIREETKGINERATALPSLAASRSVVERSTGKGRRFGRTNLGRKRP